MKSILIKAFALLTVMAVLLTGCTATPEATEAPTEAPATEAPAASEEPAASEAPAASEEPAASTLSGELMITGSTSAEPLVTVFGDLFMEANPDVSVAVQGNGSSAGITAATNGYFSSVSASPTIVTDAAQLDAATPAELNELLQNGFPAADTTNCAGQIATGFSWKFYAVCDLATADRLDGISSVKISVPGKQNTPLSAAVQELTRDEDTGLAKLVVSCQTVNAEILSFGVETAQIDLKTYEGIRIDKAALHIVDGQRGVYVKYGNLQRFLKIETLYEDENYILIPDNGKLGTDNEVRLYDEIIVQGTNLQDGKLL